MFFTLVIDVVQGELRHFSDAFDGIDTGLRRRDVFAYDAFYQPIVEDVDVRNPRQECLQSAQTLLEQAVWDVASHVLL